MKAKIHPKYEECTVTCGCGETFVTSATQSAINVEICSKCHPFYTGKQKLVDTAGRVEKFQRRYANADYTQTRSASPAPVEPPESEEPQEARQPAEASEAPEAEATQA